MNLFLISQDTNTGYDTYDSAIVVAEDSADAATINPGGFYKWKNDSWYFQFSNGTGEKARDDDTWVKPENVSVKYIGEAAKDLKRGVLLASFNAG